MKPVNFFLIVHTNDGFFIKLLIFFSLVLLIATMRIIIHSYRFGSIYCVPIQFVVQYADIFCRKFKMAFCMLNSLWNSLWSTLGLYELHFGLFLNKKDVFLNPIVLSIFTSSKMCTNLKNVIKMSIKCFAKS